MPEVSPIVIAEEGLQFTVTSLINRCPNTMMIRELTDNAMAAAANCGGRVEFREVMIDGVSKLSIWNTGGMTAGELERMSDIAVCLNKKLDLEANFGMGAKVASLPSNKYGLRIRSCKDGQVSEVILCFSGTAYGTAHRFLEDGSIVDLIDVTDVCLAENINVTEDWTEVVLFGNREDQNTVLDPYDSNPVVNKQWLADALYHRFFRIPKGVSVRLLGETNKLSSNRLFETIPDRQSRLSFGRWDSVKVSDDITIHYWFDPNTSVTNGHNSSQSGAIATETSLCCIVHKNECYSVRNGTKWYRDSPKHGITSGAKNISVFIELSDTLPIVPSQYRDVLIYNNRGEKLVLDADDFALDVQKNIPDWLKEKIISLTPQNPDSIRDISATMQKFMDKLCVKKSALTNDPNGNIRSGNSKSNRDKNPDPDPNPDPNPNPSSRKSFETPAGAKKSSSTLKREQFPKIVFLRDPKDVESRELVGKAARYYKESGELFINACYGSVREVREQLIANYADILDVLAVQTMAAEQADLALITKVSKAVVFGLSKRFNNQWSDEDMKRGLSSESLTIAADDCDELLQTARRRMGNRFRPKKATQNPIDLAEGET